MIMSEPQPINATTLLVEVHEYYGQVTAYPLNALAETFAKLAGTKTLTPKAIGIIRSLGYEIKVQPKEI